MAQARPSPPRDIPSRCCFFTGPWTVTRSSLRMLRRVAAFCRPLRPVLLLVSFPHSRSPVVGVPGLCRMWHGVPFACQRGPVVGVPGLCRMWHGVPFACQRGPVVGVLGVVPPPPPLQSFAQVGAGGVGLEPKSPKVCVPKIAQINISFYKLHFVPL